MLRLAENGRQGREKRSSMMAVMAMGHHLPRDVGGGEELMDLPTVCRELVPWTPIYRQRVSSIRRHGIGNKEQCLLLLEMWVVVWLIESSRKMAWREYGYCTDYCTVCIQGVKYY